MDCVSFSCHNNLRITVVSVSVSVSRVVVSVSVLVSKLLVSVSVSKVLVSLTSLADWLFNFRIYSILKWTITVTVSVIMVVKFTPCSIRCTSWILMPSCTYIYRGTIHAVMVLKFKYTIYFGLKIMFIMCLGVRHVSQPSGKSGCTLIMCTTMAKSGRLKTREWKMRHHQKCRGGKRGSGKRGTI